MGSSALQGAQACRLQPYLPPAAAATRPTDRPAAPASLPLQVLRFSAVGAGLVYGSIKMSYYKVRCMQASRPTSTQLVCRPQQSWQATGPQLPCCASCVPLLPSALTPPLLPLHCLLALCRARQQRRQNRRTTDCSLAGEQQH
jgi:hypothetical protein